MHIENHFPERARHLITLSSDDLLQTLGMSVLQQIVIDVLNGVNVRSATEQLTKQRVSLLNGALLAMYASMYEAGVSTSDIPKLVHNRLSSKSVDKDDQTVLRWMLGLTQKQIQNVLRSDESERLSYVVSLQDGLRKAASASREMYGEVPVHLKGQVPSWEWALSLLMTIGSQTLATRGAEKSLYGKLFEKLVLASVLSILGFRYVDPESIAPQSFWLSTRGNKRESDATAIWNLGQGVRFDIGFIGSGNTEITLDKVSRFERNVEMSGMNYYMRTFIIVDRIGKGSRVPELAEEIDGRIIQMCANDWVQTLGDQLETCLNGYRSPLRGMSPREYEQTIGAGVFQAPLEDILTS